MYRRSADQDDVSPRSTRTDHHRPVCGVELALTAPGPDCLVKLAPTTRRPSAMLNSRRPSLPPIARDQLAPTATGQPRRGRRRPSHRTGHLFEFDAVAPYLIDPIMPPGGTSLAPPSGSQTCVRGVSPKKTAVSPPSATILATSFLVDLARFQEGREVGALAKLGDAQAQPP